jgi:hypothetical protein
MDICLSPARAAASRRNGAKSSGPKTPEGKARSAQNALKHGMRAQKCIVLPGERAAAFEAFEAALLEELAPQGALQAVLAQRVVAASWRLARSERLEAELFVEARLDGGSPGLALGLALIRDGNGARAFETLLRYRGSANAELWRALRTLKALQAEQAANEPAPHELPELPIEPEARANPGESSRATAAADEAEADRDPSQGDRRAEPAADHPQSGHHSGAPRPIEPQSRRTPSEIALPAASEPPRRLALCARPTQFVPRPAHWGTVQSGGEASGHAQRCRDPKVS